MKDFHSSSLLRAIKKNGKKGFNFLTRAEPNKLYFFSLDVKLRLEELLNRKGIPVIWHLFDYLLMSVLELGENISSM